MARGSKSSPWSDDGGVIREDTADQRRDQGERDRKRRERRQRKAARAPMRRRVLSVVVALVIVGVGAALVVVRTRAIEDESAAPVPTTATSGPTSVVGTTSTTELEQLLTSNQYKRGDCVVWDEHDKTSATLFTSIVACEEPHLLEVVGRGLVPAHVTEFPDDAGWTAVFREVCSRDVGEYVGGPLDPDGRFFPTALTPNRTSWALGDRLMWCGVAQVPLTPAAFEASLDGLTTFIGSVVGQSQDRLFEPGTCVRSEPFAAVDCGTPHNWEVAGTIELPDQPTIPALDDYAGWSALVGERCRATATAFVGRPLGSDLGSGYLPVSQDSWAAGRRTLQCTVAGADHALLDHPLRGVTA